MIEKLVKLYNTLALIETKGENTKTMALCLQFVEQMIAEEKQQAITPVEPESSQEV